MCKKSSVFRLDEKCKTYAIKHIPRTPSFRPIFDVNLDLRMRRKKFADILFSSRTAYTVELAKAAVWVGLCCLLSMYRVYVKINII